MQDAKNLIITFIISFLILTLWQMFYVEPRQQEATKIAQEQQKQQAAGLQAVPVESKPIIADRQQVLAGQFDKRVRINNGRLHGSISLVGARLDDLTLAGYRQALGSQSPEVVLLSPPGTNDVYFAKFGWIAASGAVKVPDVDTVWHSSAPVLGPDKPVTLSWDNGEGVRFTLTIAIDDRYLFTVTQRVENTSAQPVSLLPYGTISRAWAQHKASTYILHEGALGVTEGKLTEITYEKLQEEKEALFKNGHGWVGITDKYWLTAFVPDKKIAFDAKFSYFNKQGQDRYQADFMAETQHIAPGQSLDATHYFFAGAKEVSQLDRYGKQLDIPLFDRAVDFGWLYFLTKPIFNALEFFKGILGNFGLAILTLTVCIKILMFPLANKSYRSFAKMKKLAPQMQEVRERYKDDKLKQNQEMMALYKRENANPLSGCLPLLVQIPVFFSLYKVLYITIEMRHAPFYGWIKDLSAPDPTSIFNLFGLISWTPPSFLHLGVLPILMGITMYIQQLLNPPPADPVQAKVTRMLPFIFTFLFATFPAGLVLYWVWNNTLSIIQQYIITRKTLETKAA